MKTLQFYATMALWWTMGLCYSQELTINDGLDYQLWEFQANQRHSADARYVSTTLSSLEYRSHVTLQHLQYFQLKSFFISSISGSVALAPQSTLHGYVQSVTLGDPLEFSGGIKFSQEINPQHWIELICQYHHTTIPNEPSSGEFNAGIGTLFAIDNINVSVGLMELSRLLKTSNFPIGISMITVPISSEIEIDFGLYIDQPFVYIPLGLSWKISDELSTYIDFAAGQNRFGIGVIYSWNQMNIQSQMSQTARIGSLGQLGFSWFED